MSATKDQEVIAEREETYGDAFQCHTNIGQVWAGILGNWQGVHVDDIPADIVALMLAGMKLVRSTRAYHEDNYIDARNYVNFSEQFKKPESITIHRLLGFSSDGRGWKAQCDCEWSGPRRDTAAECYNDFQHHMGLIDE